MLEIEPSHHSRKRVRTRFIERVLRLLVLLYNKPTEGIDFGRLLPNRLKLPTLIVHLQSIHRDLRAFARLDDERTFNLDVLQVDAGAFDDQRALRPTLTVPTFGLSSLNDVAKLGPNTTLGPIGSFMPLNSASDTASGISAPARRNILAHDS